jgi:protein TonB
MYDGRLRMMLAHHHGPYKQSLVIATLILLALFLFFPPFEFKPYTTQAEAIEVVEIPDDYEIPPPPEDIPPPPVDIEVADPGDETTDEVPPTAYDRIEDFPVPRVPNADHRGAFIVFDELPVPEYLAKPVYPPLARETGIEGAVLLKVLIGLDHRVHQAVVLSSDVTPAMEAAAVAAALKCRYKPAKQQGVEVEVWVPILITFTLN